MWRLGLVETFPYKLTVINLLNLVLEETLLAKQTKKDKSEINMKMKIILIAIIASCYAAPGYEKSKYGLINARFNTNFGKFVISFW